jgi:hypothetical protein
MAFLSVDDLTRLRESYMIFMGCMTMNGVMGVILYKIMNLRQRVAALPVIKLSTL